MYISFRWQASSTTISRSRGFCFRSGAPVPEIMHCATSQCGSTLLGTAASFCGVVEFGDGHSWSAGSNAACAPQGMSPSMPPTSPSSACDRARDTGMPFQNEERPPKAPHLFADLVSVHFALAEKREDNHFRAALLHLEIQSALYRCPIYSETGLHECQEEKPSLLGPTT